MVICSLIKILLLTMAYFDDFLRFITVTGSIPLLVEWGDIIRPVVSILAQAWSIRYIYY